ncbi:MAG: DNA gyrase inhibitor YacG [Sedimentisphaerales bacterium]|nr:DNA gyrase inhibitor YacG [Sedimentisphaerales bacterium]MBN2843805.1 DNA gyrase inhibitor YacG [Sedimentisphaerales bacterium]
MQKKENSRLKCPVCGGTIAGSEKTFPFCSERCQLVDLDRWFTGSYSIPACDEPDDFDMPEMPDEG